MDIVGAMVAGLVQTLLWPNILFIFIGVVAGLVLGIIPGLGGVTGLTLLLPFTFTLDIEQAVAVMIGLTAVTATSDTIPAVLLGVPGTSAAAATVVDGYPMAKRGEAARALGAAFMSSGIGGVLGALVLVASIPVLRPVVLAFGPPEIFMLAMWGLATVGMLGGNDPLRGWSAAGVGVTLAMVGRDPTHATPRYDFGQPALWDGLPLIAVALGLFAMPELINLSRQGRSISQVPLPKNLWSSQFAGIKDALSNWLLVLRCSAIGTWIGFLPGLGANVADWIAYGHAQTSVLGNTFGTGDVRGVIAPESANNSVKGGELIPTLAFGVPGSATMAILFGALLIAGVSPGQQLLGERLDLTMIMVWTLVIANIMGVVICLTFVRHLVKITSLPGYIVAALVGPVIILSTYASEAVLEHLLVLAAVSVLGFFMRQIGWPRPPLLVGFVLGGIVEHNLVSSYRLFGIEFLTRPLTLVIFLMVLGTLFYGVVTHFRRHNRPSGQDAASIEASIPEAIRQSRWERTIRLGFTTMLFVLLASAFIVAFTADWRFTSALMPLVFTGFGMVVTGTMLVRDTGWLRRAGETAVSAGDGVIESLPALFKFMGWFAAVYLTILVAGLFTAIPLGAAVFARVFGRTTLAQSALVGAGMLALVYGLYDQMLHIVWPAPLLTAFL